MTSAPSKFKLLHRGFRDIIVLFPGWAMDYRIFNALDLRYNYLLPVEFNPFSFEEGLLKILKRIPGEQISLLGFSLGGFAACAFAAKYPEKAKELILLSIRNKYNGEVLKYIEQRIKKNKSAYLHRFYLECFSKDDKEGLGWFKKYLMRRYIKEIGLVNLLRGLDYLALNEIAVESLPEVKRIAIFHGSDDKISPFAELREVRSKLPRAEFVCLSGIGHISFLNRQFKERFNHG